MSYIVSFTKDAINDIEHLKKSGNKQLIKKLALLFEELQEHPYSGTGQIEILKHFKEETFSRRLNREHRLVYQIKEDLVKVLVLSAYGHY